MTILCVGFLANIVAGPVSPLVQGLGRPEYQRNAEALSLVLNVSLSIVLIARFGLYGAPTGTSIAMVISAVYYVWSFHRLMRHPLRPFFALVVMRPACSSMAAGLVCVGIMALLDRLWGHAGLLGFAVVMAGVGSFAVSYVALILHSRHFDREEIAVLRRLWQSATRATPPRHPAPATSAPIVDKVYE
jgi:O-antigen/teichoic acid export membrane protein